MTDVLLDIKGLSVFFHDRDRRINIVEDVEISMKRGQVTVLVGESGSGKTTIAMSVMGLLTVDQPLSCEGQIMFEGQNLLEKKERYLHKIRGKDISMIFQEPLEALNPEMTIGEQIEEVLKIHDKCGIKDRRERVLSVMEEVGLPNPEKIYGYYPKQLSGGMRQRVIIAMSIVCNPRLVIADEPTTALDVTTQAQILSLMKELKQKEGLSILFITHDLGVAAEMADEIVVLYCGRIMERGPAAEVFKKQLHPYTEGLMNCIPYVGSRQEVLPMIPGSVPQPHNRPQTGCAFYDRCFMKNEECKRWTPILLDTGNNHRTSCLRWEELSR